MLKRIGTTQLCVGMYVHELCASWMEHPFFRRAFPLNNARDINRIIDAGVKDVWIDTSKGKDIEDGVSQQDVESQVVGVLTAAAREPKVRGEDVPINEELRHARKIVAQSKDAVFSMFQNARLGAAIEARQALPVVEEITASVFRNPEAIISIARLKNADDYTYMHSVSVCALMSSLATRLGLSEQETLDAGMAGLLHDVGKMNIPVAILNKPGKLTDEEFTVMKTHPAKGHKMLLEGKGVPPIPLDVCLHHHEKTDGSGYPHHLEDEGITLHAKMGAVCDVYDAITSDRPYKRGWEPAVAVRKMAEWCRGHFDERIFHAFVRCVGIYPVGTLVRLQSGRLGVIVEQSAKSLLMPKVRVFYSAMSQSHIQPEVIDLAQHDGDDRIIAHEDSREWNLRGLAVNSALSY